MKDVRWANADKNDVTLWRRVFHLHQTSDVVTLTTRRVASDTQTYRMIEACNFCFTASVTDILGWYPLHFHMTRDSNDNGIFSFLGEVKNFVAFPGYHDIINNGCNMLVSYRGKGERERKSYREWDRQTDNPTGGYGQAGRQTNRDRGLSLSMFL